MGLALLELQLIAMEFAAAFQVRTSAPGQNLRPAASVTLIPPKIEITVEPAAVQLGAGVRAA
jgi:hypothetical protein